MTVDLAASPLTHWTGPHDLPDYTAIRDEDFEPVIRAAFKAHLAEIEAIADTPEAPTFDNTILAMEGSGAALALSILRGAVACHSGMATFAEAGVAGG